MLRDKLQIDISQVRSDLRRNLQTLACNAKDAIQMLDEGDCLPVHLIANASMITALIAQWNLLRDIMPYLDVADL